MYDMEATLTLLNTGSPRVRRKAIEELCAMASQARSGIEIMDKCLTYAVDALEVEPDPSVFVHGCKAIAKSLDRWIVTEPELLRAYCSNNQSRSEIFVTVVSFIQDTMTRPSKFRHVSREPARASDVVASISLLLKDPQLPQSEFMRFWQKVLLAHATLGFHECVEPGGEHLLANLLFFDPLVPIQLSGGQKVQHEQPGEMVEEAWEKIAGFANVRSKNLHEKIINVRKWLAVNRGQDLEKGWVFAEDPHLGIRARYALNSRCPRETREKILNEICELHQRMTERELAMIWLRKRNNILHIQHTDQHKTLISYSDEIEFRSWFVAKSYFPTQLVGFFSNDPSDKVQKEIVRQAEKQCNHDQS